MLLLTTNASLNAQYFCRFVSEFCSKSNTSGGAVAPPAPPLNTALVWLEEERVWLEEEKGCEGTGGVGLEKGKGWRKRGCGWRKRRGVRELVE